MALHTFAYHSSKMPIAMESNLFGSQGLRSASQGSITLANLSSPVFSLNPTHLF